MSRPDPLLLGPARAAFPPFRARPPWWGPDLQTLRNTLFYRTPDFLGPPPERLRLPLADGDCLLALLNRPPVDTGKATIVLIHGLTGDENSRNIATSAAYHLRQGRPVVRLNLRGAGPSRGLCHSHYHAGRSADLRETLPALPADLLARGVALIGVSLGGNMLLKFMAENPPSMVRAAVAVSAPIDLARAQACIRQPRNALYHRHLLRQMTRDARGARDPHITPALVDSIRSIYDFDDRIVAPSNGFANAEDYYARCSAGPMLPRIGTPTLLIHAADDPWIPLAMYLERTWPETGPLTLLVPSGGGHVGFHAADSPWPWHDRCAAAFLAAACNDT